MARSRRSVELQEAEKVKKELRLKFGNASTKVLLERDEAPPGLRGRAHRVISDSRFDMAIGVVIIANSITIGLESAYELREMDTTLFELLEHVFLFIYTLELLARFFVYGLKCLRSWWVVFDFFLVTIGLFALYVFPLLLIFFEGADAEGALGFLLVLRTFRLARLARSVRLLAQFKVLWMLVRGLLSSAGTMAYVFVLFALILYVFACMGVEVITKPHLALTPAEREENLEYDGLVTTYWGSIGVTMLTLMMFSTVDSVGAIYMPMCKHRPELAFYFIPFLLLVTLCLMNLVTAVIVESSFSQAAQDKEVEKLHKAKIVEKMMPKLRIMFEGLDLDDDGEITLQEFGNCPEETRQELCDLFDTDDFVELFEVLDVDGGGAVSINEFCDEMIKLATAQVPMEQLRLLKQISMIRNGVVEGQGCMTEIMQMVQGLVETSLAGGDKDRRMAKVERKLETIDVNLFEMNRCMRVLLQAAGKEPPIDFVL
jgi:voltage-gated sodium channel